MPIIDRKESVAVLQECMDLQLKKSKDYQSDSSNVTQAMHYRRGVDTIHDIIIGKIKGRLRRDPYNEIHQEHLAMVQRNKDILLAAKTDEKVHYICDKLIRDHFHNFNLGGGQ